MSFEYLKHVTDGLDRDAVLDDLMKAYGRDVWNYALFLTRNRELADDIAQDVFVKVYERLYSYRGESSIKTWLLAITRNTARDAMRSSWLRRVMLLPGKLISSDEHPSAEREALQRELVHDIWSIVLHLPAKLREVLLLHAHHGLGMKEMAALLGLSEGTVKSRLFRARAQASRMLDKQNRQHEHEPSVRGEEKWT
ncbi:RNA polymerase sigma factor [Paenibacillus sp. MMS18-CY102]|uniref:RNA polymerase sigma factor n=1 Tax=Paenibacillus sp. MMS18-CY102 TaxID=2682849 RepID=UPI00136626E4|nr:sigma-70 family RNA polymerase sigma factor [Paenibacillus sp. MMS18-CY102]MWC30298.1 sigma-70 family RNA polymerase sigma factor [Paenibacillus sp. MMS18-CY102]